MVRNTGQWFYPKHLVATALKEMHDRFGHCGFGKTYSLKKGIISG